MIDRGMVEDAEAGPDCATLGFVAPIHYAKNPGLDDCAGAHGAGLNRDVQGGSEDAVIPDGLGCRAQRQDFSVRCRVARRNRAIASTGEDALAEHNDRTHRHFALFGRGTRLS
jgi:hypothetical protein